MIWSQHVISILLLNFTSLKDQLNHTPPVIIETNQMIKHFIYEKDLYVFNTFAVT